MHGAAHGTMNKNTIYMNPMVNKGRETPKKQINSSLTEGTNLISLTPFFFGELNCYSRLFTVLSHEGKPEKAFLFLRKMKKIDVIEKINF